MAIAAVPVRPRLRVHFSPSMIVDFRSDTISKPTSAMLEYMRLAPVGDDVFSEDPTVNNLEEYIADLFGMESALFCPSGTMSNQIAIKAQTQPGDEVICDEGAHVHYYEGGGIAFNSNCSTRTLKGERGVFTSEQLLEALRPADQHFPRTSLVSIENSCNRGGGKIFDLDEIKKIHQICKDKDLSMHLDGARLFNAIVANQVSAKTYGSLFDSISICLSKGLGAPVGSLLLGSASMIQDARRIRKVLGGGMRQAGVVASAGMFALQNHVERLKLDNQLAKEIETILNASSFVNLVWPVETNIVVFELDESIAVSVFLEHLDQRGIKAFQVGPKHIRFVTHLDLPNKSAAILSQALSELSS